MLSNEKKFKRLVLLASAYKLELEELEEMDEQYIETFSNDFSEESIFDSTQKSIEPITSSQESYQEQSSSQVKPKDGPLKKIYRYLANKYHPDKGGCEEKFKKIQADYEKNNVFAMIEEIHKYDDVPSLPEKDLIELEKLIEKQRKKSDEIKQTCRWAWAHSNKGDSIRRDIQRTLGIDPDKFLKWKAQRSKVT